MKKILLVLMAFAVSATMFVSCTDSANEKESDAEKEQEAADEEESDDKTTAESDDETTGEAKDRKNEETDVKSDDKQGVEISDDEYVVEFIGCNYADEVTALDKEYIGNIFSGSDDEVYVDLVLGILNNSDENFTENSISAYVMYEDARYDMQFEVESDFSTGFLSYGAKYVVPGDYQIIHLFKSLEKDAENEDLTVTYSVNGRDFECEVSPKDNRDALKRKTKVFVGDKVDANGLYKFEVVSCKTTKILKAQDLENTEQYEPMAGGKEFFELVLKIKNNSDFALNDIRGYTEIDGEFVSATAAIETDNNTDIDKYGSLASGEEEYYHIYTTIDEDADTDGLIMRFNLGNVCYYCEIEE